MEEIEMRRDEEEADRFYQERLKERCWDVWRQGFDWIITTNEQISEARDNIILQTQFQCWRSRTSSKLELYARIATISDNRLIRRMLDVWRARLKVKRQNKWRQDMRKKMKIIRERRETNLQKEVWVQWRQSYRSRLAREYYSKRLLLRFHKRWKDSLVSLDHLDTIADNALKSKDSRLLSGFWYRWRRALEIRSAEKAVEELVNVRIMAEALTKWKSRMHTMQTADEFYDTMVMKRAIHSWKAARDGIHALDARADKRLGRQDDILLRAVMRVWKAHERGKLLERVKSLRAVKAAWAAWQNSIAVQREREVMQNAFRIWRAQLREKLNWHRQARMVEKHLITRRAWNRWQERLAELRREKQLKGLETERLRDIITVSISLSRPHSCANISLVWAQRAHRSREYRIAEETIATAINLVRPSLLLTSVAY
ncbi:Sfi1 spindle body protein-domain-containing protein [Salix suchowensis]|nr:Sfi1 spindle body protein-domain-containing protein [Salix suchowensis]